MYKSPDLPVPTIVYIFPEKARDLWLKALERPDADTKCKAAGAIAEAHRRGMKGLDATVAPLVRELDRGDQHPSVRLAVAKALVTLGARDAAPSLLQHAQADGREMREIVEPALAHWDYRPARAIWLERIRDSATPQRSLILAIQQLAIVREEQAADRLREIMLSDRLASPIRLEAARALGAVRHEELESDAERLAADTSSRGMVARLCAASVLHRHRSKRAIELLQHLIEDKEPAIVAIALARLIEIDPELAVPAAERLLANADAGVRLLAVEVLRQRPSDKHVGLLGKQLDDEHLDVRRQSRRALQELATKPQLHDAVLAAANKMLATKQWRGLEQATILVSQLDHKPAAKRLIELLTFDRPEVFITAAWGLRKLDVPESLPAVKSHVEAQMKRLLGGLSDASAQIPIDNELSQLNQLLGRRRYAPADSLLRQFIARRLGMAESRAAAIWALGLIHEGIPDAELTTALEARLNDISSMPSESTSVRWMSAITLGRTKATAAIPSLRRFYVKHEPSGDDKHEAPNNPISNACGWALEQITGEVVPPPKTITKIWHDLFLVPKDE